VFGIQPDDPGALIAGDESRFGAFGDAQIVEGMLFGEMVSFTCFGEQFGAMLADHIEHVVSGGGPICRQEDQTLVQQAAECVDAGRNLAYGLDGFEVPSTRKHREPAI
jgi:hypothetical protein